MSKTAEVQADSVGALLRQSREQKGLTTAEVAMRLRLKTSQIEKIEAEEWDPAVSVTFMRGYLRAYARLLKLSEKEILQNFELQTAYLRNQAKPMHSFSKKNRLDAVDNRFMLATYLLVVLLIGLFLMWFWQTHVLDSQPVSVVPEYRVAAEPSNELTAFAQPATVNDPSATLEQITQSSSTEALVAESQVSTELVLPASAETTTQEMPTAAASTAVSELATAENTDAVSATLDEQQSLAETTVNVPEPSSIGETPNANATQLAQLHLTFSEQCWVTVEDATGKRLAYGMKSAGQSLQLTGQLPLRVTLGNAAAATIQLDQKAVDLSGYRSGQVARLTLDGQL